LCGISESSKRPVDHEDNFSVLLYALAPLFILSVRFAQHQRIWLPARRVTAVLL